MPILHDSKYQNMKKYVAHGHYSVYDHCFRVALFAYSYAKCKGIKVDYWSLIRGSLLHDYYLYDWHHTHEGHRLHGFRHPYFSLHNAKKKIYSEQKGSEYDSLPYVSFDLLEASSFQRGMDTYLC